MRRSYVLLLLGIWVAILPYLGFPYSWKDGLTALTGLGIMYVSFIFYQEYKIKGIKEEKTFDNFIENKPLNENEN